MVFCRSRFCILSFCFGMLPPVSRLLIAVQLSVIERNAAENIDTGLHLLMIDAVIARNEADSILY